MNYLKQLISLAVFTAFLLSARAAFADTVTGSSLPGDSIHLASAAEHSSDAFHISDVQSVASYGMDGSPGYDEASFNQVKTRDHSLAGMDVVSAEPPPSSPSPEPSGLMVLGSGMLGLAGAMRCQFKQ